MANIARFVPGALALIEQSTDATLLGICQDSRLCDDPR